MRIDADELAVDDWRSGRRRRPCPAGCSTCTGQASQRILSSLRACGLGQSSARARCSSPASARGSPRARGRASPARAGCARRSHRWMALRIAGAVGISACSPMPLAPNGPSGDGSSIRIELDRRHVADRRDQVVVQVLAAAGDELLHQRHAEPLRDAALDLAFDQGRIDRAADIVGGRDLQDAGRCRARDRPRPRPYARRSRRRHRARPARSRRAASSADRRSSSAASDIAARVGAASERARGCARCSPSLDRDACPREGDARALARHWRAAGCAARSSRAGELGRLAGDEGLARGRGLAAVGREVGVGRDEVEAVERRAERVGGRSAR